MIDMTLTKEVQPIVGTVRIMGTDDAPSLITIGRV